MRKLFFLLCFCAISALAQTCNNTVIAGSIICKAYAYGGGEPSADATLSGTSFQGTHRIEVNTFLLRPGSPWAKFDQVGGNITSTQTTIPFSNPPITNDTATTSAGSTVVTLGTATYCSDLVSGRYGHTITNAALFAPGTTILYCVDGYGGTHVKISQPPISVGSGAVVIAYTFPDVTGIAAASIGNHGAHYPLGSILNINAGNSMGQVEVTGVDINGAITSIVITAQTPANFLAASGYSIANGIQTTCALPLACPGTGATINILATGWVLTVTDDGLGPGFEKMLVTGNANNVLSVVRGYLGSVAIPHWFTYFTPQFGAFNPGPYPNLISYMTDSAGNLWDRTACVQTEYTDNNTVPMCLYSAVFTPATAATANTNAQDVVTFTHPYTSNSQNEIAATWFSGLGTISSVNNPQPTNGYASNPLGGTNFNSSMTMNGVIPVTPSTGWFGISPGDFCLVSAGGSPRSVINGSAGLLYPLGATLAVNTSGGNQVNGSGFNVTYGAWPPGSPITIGSQTYHLASVNSASSITTIETNIPTLNGAIFAIADQGAPPNPLTGWTEYAGDVNGRMMQIGAIATGSNCNGGAYVSADPDGMFAIGVAFHPVGVSTVAVPNVVGLTQAAATTALTGAGLALGSVTTASSQTVAAGLVISEAPSAGTSVAIGSGVALVISTGQQQQNPSGTISCTGGTMSLVIPGTTNMPITCTVSVN